MILRQSTLRPVPKKKRINLSAMLTSEYFFHRSIQIQMALNQDRILPRDYLIKKAKSKIKLLLILILLIVIIIIIHQRKLK